MIDKLSMNSAVRLFVSAGVFRTVHCVELSEAEHNNRDQVQYHPVTPKLIMRVEQN